ncbi:MAG: hypothetical protein PHU75_03810 [Candidatus Nanopelagicales bacterium]|nr:hypothetical protein [Candidatus Nanopelagicales bacterium]
MAESERAVNLDAAPFTPSAPLAPTTTGVDPIVWAPGPGYNLTYTADKKDGTRNDVLRSFAENCPPIRVVIEQLKREMRGMAVDIVPLDAKAQDADTPEQRELRQWLRRPDGRLSWGAWVNALIEDLVVIGAPAVARLRDVGGRPRGLRLIDSANIVPIVMADGCEPAPPAAAYYQVLHGQPYREYTTDELIYRPFNARTWTPYGYGPVEQTLLYCALALNRTLWYTQSYTEGTTPPGWGTLPKEWTAAQIAEFQKLMDAMMAGNGPNRQHIQYVPEGFTFIRGAEGSPWTYEFDEFLMRVFSWAIGVAPTPVVKNSTLGQGTEGLSQEALAAGVMPLQYYLEEILDDYVQNADSGLTVAGESIPMGLGASGYEFCFVDQREENKAQRLTEDDLLVKLGARTINEVRVSRGEDKLDEPAADLPLVMTGTGYVLLSDVLKEPAPTPPALLPFTGQVNNSAEEPAEEPTEEPVGEPSEPSAKSDLAKWQRKVAKAGGKARPFVSAAIPEWRRYQVETALKAGAGTRAFGKPASVPGVTASPRAAAVAAEGAHLWEGLMKSWIAHYAAEAVAAVAEGGENGAG